jgi:tripartite-type tricarboxylate transporter receptor subunit TctC
MMLNKMLGTKFKVVEGYGSTNAIILAIERGEVEGICMSSSTLLGPRVDLIEKGVLKILFNVEAKPMPAPPGVPTIFDRFNDEQKQIVSLINSAIEFGRPFAAPPGVPPERLAALRAALKATVADADFVAEASKLKFIVTYTSPQEMADIAARMYATPKQIIDAAAALMPAD